MAHEVTLNLQEKIILHKDVEFEIKLDGAKLGTLLISKGNIGWLPSGNSINKKRMTWKRFAEIMEHEGTPVRSKK
ncbi:hypothetical protein KIF53_16985 [Chromobacterium subtsugae]|uniref:ATP-dependent DNA ligase family profile domain-containing protein n=1 Tax=Chromobacterium subtsugae TaxID=251747 RepID=A0ABS7FIM0_9NEIS|nr:MULTISPECIES: hypothetical protein [Chromobacterium]KUM02193.1 hypothetical protein Cv017_04525 [Chromobacterium subtsugae]MBW7568220.1 hypothetical protein [Chromobacterium subtsugae]MBW8289330.1 hypothetical protein [Chromobacterium subtsugae]WSE90415.1 hypothetical protein U6115_16155 [Chromobacterium subtsugae]WVH58787.1 hypothetical protein U6151_16180 [Chromobacterium subtsugae]